MGTNIDLLSVDMEGNDFDVLKSINLKKYTPKLIIIETFNFNILNPRQEELYIYLHQFGYELVGIVLLNAYFIYKGSTIIKP